MEWTRSETIAMAREDCVHCKGVGILRRRRDPDRPCGCVLRAIFRACLYTYWECQWDPKGIGATELEYQENTGWRCYGHRRSEYIADFELVARRRLSPELHRVFRLHHLLGYGSAECCRGLSLSKLDLFYRVYHLEELLGRTFCELQPYPLFPVYEYFGPLRK